MSEQELSVSEQEELRREKVNQLRELGVNPYPNSFEVTHHSISTKSNTKFR